jgi:hypothetical protein
MKTKTKVPVMKLRNKVALITVATTGSAAPSPSSLQKKARTSLWFIEKTRNKPSSWSSNPGQPEEIAPSFVFLASGTGGDVIAYLCFDRICLALVQHQLPNSAAAHPNSL